MFNNLEIKKQVLDKCRNLKDLADEHAFKKIYLKQEQPPLTRKENTRLYNEFKKLQEAHRYDDTVQIKL